MAKADGDINVKAIDSYLKKEMKEQAIEGLSYAIVKDNQIVYSKAFGMADIGRQLTPKTPMKLASLSKSFTALAIMQLVEQGKINLDAPIRTYIPWFQLQDKESSRKIIIRQLLNQTSGISANGEVEIANELKGKSLEETVRLLERVKLSHPVGSKFEYTNLNYLCLGLVVEKVSGQSLANYDKEDILKPLNMNNSFTSIGEAEKHGLSKSYTSWFGLHFPTKNTLDDLPNFLASGYMVSSAEDMAKYLLAYMNKGGAVLSKEGIRQLQSPSPAAKMYLDGKFFGNYAMGWWSRSIQGTKVVGHSGDLFSSARTDMYILPEKRIGLVVLTNTNNGKLAPGDSHISTDGVISILSGKQPIMDINENGFQWYYLLFDSIVLVLFSFLVLLGLKKKWSVVLIAFSLLLPIAIYIGLPRILQVPSWSFLFCLQSDLVTVFLLATITLFVLAMVKGLKFSQRKFFNIKFH